MENKNESSFLIPYFESFFKNGLSVQELNIGEKHKRQMEVVLAAWEYYKQNPWVTDFRQFFRQQGCPTKQISQNIQYLEHLKINFRFTSRAEAQNMVDYAARTALQQASAAGDRQDMLKAAAILTKAHQLDKPEVDKEKAKLVALPVVFTPYVEDIDPERVTIEDKKMYDIMRQFGALPDKMEAKIREKNEALQES